MNDSGMQRELYELFSNDYPSESARRKAAYRYCDNHHGLSMALLKQRERTDPLRRNYMRRLIVALAAAAAMIASVVILVVRYAAFELDVILASPSLRFGFVALLLTVALLVMAAFILAFWTRAALNAAAYELLARTARAESSVDRPA